MDNSIIGTQITKFRKALRITQEELGKAVGVSTQAVSRWECGGTPDVTLLPAIADKLGVSVDALFGREGSETLDLHSAVSKWVRSLPEEKVFDQLNRLLWTGIIAIPGDFVKTALPFPESCYQVDLGGKYSDVLNRSIFQLDSGVYFSVGGEDFSFSTICPRPEKGYDAYFPDNQDARELFTLLAMPGCLEVLEYMLRQDSRYYSVEVLAKGTDMDVKTVSGLMQQMDKTGLTESLEVGFLDGPAKVYTMPYDNGPGFLVLLYLARCLQHPSRLNYLNLSFREEPLL